MLEHALDALLSKSVNGLSYRSSGSASGEMIDDEVEELVLICREPATLPGSR